MPIAADANLDRLYARQRLLDEEALRLEGERDALVAQDAETDRAYVLDVAAGALREESTRLTAMISDILDRDLQR